MQIYSIRFRYDRIRVSIGCVLLTGIFFLPQLSRTQLAYDKDKFLGNIIGNGYNIPDDFDYYWNQVTPENSSKWGSVEGTRDNMNWGGLDRIYEFAQYMEFPFRFHVLVWGKQQPEWITSLDSTEQAEEVEEWIRLAGERYNDADYVEVVNEAIEWPPYDYYPSYRDALGGAGETGWDWVINAFNMAREYFPNSKLLLNEEQILGGNKSISTYLEIINLLKDRDLIDGICVQGHFLENVSTSTIKSKLDQLAATGLPIQITEFDLNYADDTQQLNKYQSVFPVLWEHPAVVGITLWGYVQGQIWRTDAYLVRSDGSERPAMEWLWDYVPSTTAIKFPSAVGSKPECFHLHQNYPNPFNPWTEITYKIPEPGHVKMEIYNLSGQSVRTLVDEVQFPGEHTVQWNALDDSGNRVPSGVYFYNLRAEGSSQPFTESRKMLLLK
jgi:endo-1,4-beta-xylanase